MKRQRGELGAGHSMENKLVWRAAVINYNGERKYVLQSLKRAANLFEVGTLTAESTLAAQDQLSGGCERCVCVRTGVSVCARVFILYSANLKF